MKRISVREVKERSRQIWSQTSIPAMDAEKRYLANMAKYIGHMLATNTIPAKYAKMSFEDVIYEMPYRASADELRQKLLECKTRSEARKAIRACGFYIEGNDSAEVGCFSVWLSENLRVYKRRYFPGYILQIWNYSID